MEVDLNLVLFHSFTSMHIKDIDSYGGNHPLMRIFRIGRQNIYFDFVYSLRADIGRELYDDYRENRGLIVSVPSLMYINEPVVLDPIWDTRNFKLEGRTLYYKDIPLCSFDKSGVLINRGMMPLNRKSYITIHFPYRESFVLTKGLLNESNILAPLA